MSVAPTCVFDHVHVFCSDLAATERWFISAMGAELVRRREVRGTPLTEVRLGGAFILLRGAHRGEGLTEPGPAQFGTDHFGLRVQDLDAAYREFKQRGVQFESEPYESAPGTRVVFLRGPDRVRIELVQRDRPLGE